MMSYKNKIILSTHIWLFTRTSVVVTLACTEDNFDYNDKPGAASNVYLHSNEYNSYIQNECNVSQDTQQVVSH